MLVLKLESVFADKAKENLSRGGKGLPILVKVNTQKEVAKVANLSHGTLDKVKQIQSKGSEELKELLQTQEISINQAYKEIKKVSKVSKVQLYKTIKV